MNAQPTLPVAAAAPASDESQYLTFMLQSEIYAIGILSVKEIIEYGTLTAVPMMPDCVRGVINLRGAVVPVMDLAACFGAPPAALNRRTCIVIVEARSGESTQDVGIVVDAVNEVLDIAPGDIEPTPAFGASIRTEFVRGMGKVRERFVVILDIDRVLAGTDMTAIAEAA